MIPFGPQLIGQTEKTLNAVLRSILVDYQLSEPQWVTLSLATQLDAGGDLGEFVAQRAHFADAPQLVTGLAQRGLLAEGQLTPAADEIVAAIRLRIATVFGPVLASLEPDDVVAAERVLNSVLESAREVVNATRG